jgi:hypothetical protein
LGDELLCPSPEKYLELCGAQGWDNSQKNELIQHVNVIFIFIVTSEYCGARTKKASTAIRERRSKSRCCYSRVTLSGNEFFLFVGSCVRAAQLRAETVDHFRARELECRVVKANRERRAPSIRGARIVENSSPAAQKAGNCHRNDARGFIANSGCVP